MLMVLFLWSDVLPLRGFDPTGGVDRLHLDGFSFLDLYFPNAQKYCVKFGLALMGGGGCQVLVASLRLPMLFVYVPGIPAWYPASSLSHDVQRPISGQRSPQDGACSEQHQSAAAATRAS